MIYHALPLLSLQELQELHSALEEAKADIVGLWALRYLIDQVSNVLFGRYCCPLFVSFVVLLPLNHNQRLGLVCFSEFKLNFQCLFLVGYCHEYSGLF